jgi:hypothetical protein
MITRTPHLLQPEAWTVSSNGNSAVYIWYRLTTSQHLFTRLTIWQRRRRRLT